MHEQDAGGEKRPGRPPGQVRGLEPGASYVAGLRRWPDEVAQTSRAALARQIGCSESYLSDLLSNSSSWKATQTRLKWARKIIEACGGTPTDMKNWVDYHNQVATYQVEGGDGRPPTPPEPGQLTADEHARLDEDDLSTLGRRLLGLSHQLDSDQHRLGPGLYARRASPPTRPAVRETRFSVLVRRMATWSIVAVLGLLGAVLLAPVVLSPILLGAVAVLSLFVGCYLLLASLLFRVVARVVMAVERKVSTQTGIEYVLRGSVLALLMVTVGYVGIRYAVAGLPAPWHDYLPLVVVGVVAWWAVGSGIRGYRIDRAARSAGVPGVVAGWRRDGKPESFVWRRAAQGLYDRLTGSPEWRRPWSSTRQDQIAKEYDALLDAHATLLRQAARPWRQWLVEDHARAAVLCAVWAAGTVGLVLIVVVELVQAGHSLLRMVGVAIGAIFLVSGIAIAGVWLAHGVMRHRDTQLAAELADALATLQPLTQDQPTD